MKHSAGVLLLLASLLLLLLPFQAAAEDPFGEAERLRDFGRVNDDPGDFVVAGGVAFFTAQDQHGLWGVWRTDGTAAGTFQVGPTTQLTRRPKLWSTYGNLVFFVAPKDSNTLSRDLWRTDGTRAGTFRLTQEMDLQLSVFSDSSILPVPETGLVFFGTGPLEGSPNLELWATDGTAAGTRLVKDIHPSGSSAPGSMVALGGRLFFLASTPSGRELWRSDGTAAGTVRIQGFDEVGFQGSVQLQEAGGKLLVLVETETGAEVWRSDGTAAGTVRIAEIADRSLYLARVAGGRLFFALRPKIGVMEELWVTDGTAGGTVLLHENVRGIDWLEAVGENVVFRARDDSHDMEPWWSDGTPEGTRLIADLCPQSSCGSFPGFLGTYKGRAVLTADDGVSGYNPWLTDGTAAGTHRLADLCPGPCDAIFGVAQVDGWLMFLHNGDIWASDGSAAGTFKVVEGLVPPFGGFIADAAGLPGRLVFTLVKFHTQPDSGSLWTLPVAGESTPPAPPGDWLTSARVPGFRFKVRIAGATAGRQESSCIAETLCVSGALAGRSEVFLRVVGPRPNGYLWPTLVKFSTSLVEVWVEQTATGQSRYYRLEASGPTGSTLPGIADRTGFLPAGALALEEIEAAETPPPPPGTGWITTPDVPGFRVQARLTSGDQTRSVQKEPCISETLCLSGAVAGRPELFVRVVGPKPNGYLWPTIVRFTTSTVEVWIEQQKTGIVRYYRLEAPPRDSTELNGLVDKQGFRP